MITICRLQNKTFLKLCKVDAEVYHGKGEEGIKVRELSKGCVTAQTQLKERKSGERLVRDKLVALKKKRCSSRNRSKDVRKMYEELYKWLRKEKIQ